MATTDRIRTAEQLRGIAHQAELCNDHEIAAEMRERADRVDAGDASAGVLPELTPAECRLLIAHFQRAATRAGRSGDLSVATGLRATAAAMDAGQWDQAELAQAYVRATTA